MSGSGPHGPTDPGLQAERTALAWRRTGLSLVAAALVAVRVLPAIGGAWSLAPACAGLAVAVAVVAAAQRRYRHQRRALASPPADVGADGLLPALVTTATLLVTFGALVGTVR